jgi:glycosyltransferase involved in cell wall biosynthesis
MYIPPTDSKVATVIFFTSSASQGGAEKQLALLCNNLPRYRVIVFILGRGDYLYRHLSSNVSAIDVCVTTASLLEIPSKLCYLIRLSRRIISSADPNLRINFIGWLPLGNIVALFVSLFCGLPHRLFFCHRSSFFLYQSAHSQLLLVANLLVSSLFSRRITHISNSATIYSSRLVRALLGRSRLVVQNGFEPPRQTIQVSPTTMGLREQANAIRFLYVARFSPEKNHKLLFRVLNRFPHPFSLCCIGSGCSLSNHAFAALVRKYRISGLFRGSVSDMEEYYSSSDLTLLLSGSEGFPNVIAESMYCGTICAALPVGEVSHIIGDAGFIFESSDPGVLASQLAVAYSLWLEGGFAPLSSKAHARISSMFSVEVMSKHYSELFFNH